MCYCVGYCVCYCLFVNVCVTGCYDTVWLILYGCQFVRVACCVLLCDLLLCVCVTVCLLL